MVGSNNKVIKVKFTGNKAALKKVKVKGLNVYQAVTTITNKASESGLLKNNDKDNLLLLNYANLLEKDNNQIQDAKIKQSVEAGLSNSKNHRHKYGYKFNYRRHKFKHGRNYWPGHQHFRHRN